MNLDEKFTYMATGKTYNDLDPILVAERKQSTKLTNELNQETDPVKKEQLIRHLFGSAGLQPDINPNFRCEFGRNIHVGDYFYANYDAVILDGAKVTIGDDVIIGAGSVVTHDIPNNVVAAGNPCRILRKITDTDKTGFVGKDFI
ncbi:maltose acetyltransferase domain-containing protein [Weissella sagaensis]|uniref:maltose acetyltransferase domain-containing protein n=1 Tax=Weissella sagaensis TaxID=2559928 RepID=UPI00214A9D19|nr:maltose acetyltransferase domain-containing protein [Weissella sagaensis]